MVVVVKPSDDECMDGINQVPLQPAGGATNRQKTVTIHIETTIPSKLSFLQVILLPLHK